MAVKKYTKKSNKKITKKNNKKSNKNSNKKSNKKIIKGGDGEILTYAQNQYNNDPQYSQLDTRHMFSEQIKPMLGGKRGKRSRKNQKTVRNLRMRMKGGRVGSGIFTNLLNSDGGFNHSSMQNLQINNKV